MRIRIKGLSGSFMVELSGAELEVFDRILGKVRGAYDIYVNGKNWILPTNDHHGLMLELVPADTPTITQDEYDRAIAQERMKAAAEMVEAIMQAPTATEQAETAKRLKDQLYYNYNMISHNDRDKYFWERGSLEHECVDFMAEGLPTVRVNKDGSIEKFPV